MVEPGHQDLWMSSHTLQGNQLEDEYEFHSPLTLGKVAL